MEFSRQKHWDTIYKSTDTLKASWAQEVPLVSLQFIQSFGMSKEASIIDIGGGDSKLVDFLLDCGYENITVLDISAQALMKSKNRLGNRARKVKWIQEDITEFSHNATYDIWHDRATFHFLTTNEDIDKYLSVAAGSVTGFMTIGTFSDVGPEKCSGLSVRQYSEDRLTRQLEKDFDRLRCMTVDHYTPTSAKQNFLFCSFKRKRKGGYSPGVFTRK